jgi:hypothetical protein
LPQIHRRTGGPLYSLFRVCLVATHLIVKGGNETGLGHNRLAEHQSLDLKPSRRPPFTFAPEKPKALGGQEEPRVIAINLIDLLEGRDTGAAGSSGIYIGLTGQQRREEGRAKDDHTWKDPHSL